MDDELIEVLLDRAIRRSSEPSKRSVRNKSGRASRRHANNVAWLKSVGGYANPIAAIYGGADTTSVVKYNICVTKDNMVPQASTSEFQEYLAPKGQWLGRAPAV